MADLIVDPSEPVEKHHGILPVASNKTDLGTRSFSTIIHKESPFIQKVKVHYVTAYIDYVVGKKMWAGICRQETATAFRVMKLSEQLLNGQVLPPGQQEVSNMLISYI